MTPLAWAAAGGAAAFVILLVRRASAGGTSAPTSIAPQSAEPAPTPIMYGETQRVPLAVPSGWRRATSADVAAVPELRDKANALRATPGFTSMAYGTLTPFVASDGNTYATWVEQHYHEPGGPVKPWGYHHGVTILAQKDTSVLSGEWGSLRFGGQS